MAKFIAWSAQNNHKDGFAMTTVLPPSYDDTVKGGTFKHNRVLFISQISIVFVEVLSTSNVELTPMRCCLVRSL